METNTRLKLDMLGRADAFCTVHPDPDPANMQVATRLADGVVRAEDLMVRYRTNDTIVSAAVDHKIELRGSIELGLGALFGIAKAASAAHPDISIHRRVPAPRTSEVTLLTTTRVAVAQATAVKDLLLPFGLTQGLLDGLTGDADAFDAEIIRQSNAEATKVGARAELKGVVKDLMLVVRNLDAVFKHRYKKDRELIAAWKSARNVAWRLAEPAPTEPTGPAAPGQAA